MSELIRIPSGQYRPWPKFQLILKSDLCFVSGRSYHLKGENGSGKSSFIRQILLPALKSRDLYYIYLAQQSDTQFYVCKADAAISHYPQPIRSRIDMFNYLLHCLRQKQLEKPKPVLVIADEFGNEANIQTELEDSGFEYCLCLISHNDIIPGLYDQIVQFKAIQNQILECSEVFFQETGSSPLPKEHLK